MQICLIRESVRHTFVGKERGRQGGEGAAGNVARGCGVNARVGNGVVDDEQLAGRCSCGAKMFKDL